MVRQLTSEQIEELRQYSSPDIDEAVQHLHVRPTTEGYLGYDIRCLFPDFGPMVGYAVTVLHDNLTPDRPRRPEVQRKYLEAIASSPKPAVVVFQCVAHNKKRSLVFGGMMSSTAHALGAIGLVTNGGVRDLDQVRELGFHFFAPGTVVSHGAGAFPNILEVGNPVTISNQIIRPGDLIHADKNGLIIIPEEVADQVSAGAEQQRQNEAKTIAFLQGPDFSLEAYLQRSGLA